MRIFFLLAFIHILHGSCQDDLTFTEHFGIGAAAGCATTAAIEPIIYIKNRWQQGRHLSHVPRHFYRGLFVNAAGFVPTMAIQNSAFSHVISSLDHTQINDPSKHMIAALIAGTASAIPSCPRELLIVQQQNYGGNSYQVAKQLVKTHGPSVLMRGFLPIAKRNTSFAGFFFIATPRIQHYVEEQTESETIRTLLPSILAGSGSALLTHPIDTIKTRIQAELEPKSAIQIARELYQLSAKRRLCTLYAGLVPRMIGVALTMCLEYNFRHFFTKTYQQRTK